jgi:DnaK suppressor protein
MALDIGRYAQQLEGLRDELHAETDTGREAAGIVELDQSRVGRLSRMDALQAQAMSVAAQRRRAVLLARVQSALARLDNGDYGVCLRCGEWIAAARLDVDPTVTLCIDCASADET